MTLGKICYYYFIFLTQLNQQKNINKDWYYKMTFSSYNGPLTGHKTCGL
jgi:hypothetical protein